jgi:anaerobic magnesium-protoporphyrin IX monomethyl ester cyclase
MMVYPGSKDYKKIQKLGWEMPTTWNQYSQYSYECFPLKTKHLSNAEVLWFRDNAFQTYYTSPDYLDMVKDTFGQATVDEILEMTKIKLKRRLLGDAI